MPLFGKAKEHCYECGATHDEEVSAFDYGPYDGGMRYDSKYTPVGHCAQCGRPACEDHLYTTWENWGLDNPLCKFCAQEQADQKTRKRKLENEQLARKMQEWEKANEWKRKIDEKFRLEEEQKATEAARRLGDFQREHYCYICNKPSRGPVLGTDQPSDLTRCLGCGQWICADTGHTYRGFCKRCAANL